MCRFKIRDERLVIFRKLLQINGIHVFFKIAPALGNTLYKRVQDLREGR